MKEVKTSQFGSAKWFWSSTFAKFAEAAKRHNKA
jgi:hypothetical protein